MGPNRIRRMEPKPGLDRMDCEILAALQNDARLSNKELAAAVGLAPSTCLERVRRLREAGVLRSFRAELDAAAVGVGLQAMIAVRLRQHSRDLVDAFRAHVVGLPEVVALYHVAGADDFLVHVAVRDAAHLRDLALDAFTRREEVAHLQTSLVFEHTRTAGLPIYAGPEPAPAPSPERRGVKAKGRAAGGGLSSDRRGHASAEASRPRVRRR